MCTCARAHARARHDGMCAVSFISIYVLYQCVFLSGESSGGQRERAREADTVKACPTATANYCVPAAMDVDSVPDNTSARTSGSGDALRLAWNTRGWVLVFGAVMARMRSTMRTWIVCGLGSCSVVIVPVCLSI